MLSMPTIFVLRSILWSVKRHNPDMGALNLCYKNQNSTQVGHEILV